MSSCLCLADILVKEMAGGFPLVGSNQKGTFVIDNKDAEVVTTVAKCVINDIKTVTGKTLGMKKALVAGDYPIIAGTIGQSDIMDALIAEGKVDTTGMTGRWEAYSLQIISNPKEGVEQALVVIGSTPRGTAYGLFEISRRIGVSPYIWWADVAPAPRSVIYLHGDRTEVEAPSVQYRGLFINDEDWAMLPWAKKTIDKAYNNIGPNTYAQVMELLLRLRANCLWPAKHGSSKAFWAMEENKKLAKAWAIVMSSGDSMLRDNLWEWPRFKSGNNSSNFSFAYNPEGCTDYWAKRAGEARNYEGIYDIGMRGLQDVALLGYEGQAAQLAGLADIIATQRKIITDSLGGDPTKVPQIYIPYKEALTLYNAGLKIPNDVTLCWVDDNYAYIRQLPTATEQKRSGGNGIYYHLSYLGNPCSYIWLSTISPTLISYELSKAYENGMQRFWMVNVGDVKPTEVEFEFFCELAWNVNSWTPEKAWQFSRWWSAKTFGEDLADEMADIRLEHYRLAAQGKPETLNAVTWSNDEMVERIKQYQALAARVQALEASIPERLQDAYYELFTYPIVATAWQNVKLLGAKLSYRYAAVGNYAQTMMYANMARTAYSEIVEMTNRYNKEIAGGKWDGMMNMSPNANAVTSQFGMPFTAMASEVNAEKGEVVADDNHYIDITSYIASRGNWQTLRNLGVGDNSITVWPIDYTVYNTTSARMRGPYVEYSIPLKKGKYQIVVRCLPTFPITTSNDLVVGLSVNNATPMTQSIKCSAETNKWSENVMLGYAEARFAYTAKADMDYSLKIFTMNPALVLSQIVYRRTDDEDLDLTTKLLVNPDFELYKSGSDILPNTDGTARRGVPYGWSIDGTITGNSYGIGFPTNGVTYNEGGNICWFSAKPMPTDFRLYQTIPANKLTPGIYEVGCWLWNETGKRGSCRFFANDHVQWYSGKSNYNKILHEGEINSYGDWKSGYNTYTFLHPMRIILAVHEGEDLTVGIKTSNVTNDGAQTDENGWFKVDHFTVRRLGDIPTSDPDSLTHELIVNSDFEYKDETTLADGKNVTGSAPYGWELSYTGTYTMTSSGLYGNGAGMHGKNYCAFTSTGYRPMPTDLCLYQTIPASKLTPGTYRVSCLFWSEEGLEGQGRLFANNEVQYYGAPNAYKKNLTEGEHNSFASYISACQSVDGTSMQEMSVVVSIGEGEDLTIGVRSGCMKSDGTLATGTDRTGKFRVDYFRIEKLSSDAPDAITLPTATHPTESGTGLYDLTGRRMPASSTRKGIYIQNGKKIIK